MSGRRIGVKGKPRARDRFVNEELIDHVPAGLPFAVSTRVGPVTPGEWLLTAELLARSGDMRSAAVTRSAAGTHPLEPAVWSWRQWRIAPGPSDPIATGMAAYSRSPATIFGIWPMLVTLGVIGALAIQAALVFREGLDIRAALLVSALAVVAGGVGAKLWYVVLHRAKRADGWCIQGLLLVATVTLVTLAPVVQLPLGAFLDVSAPALLFGMAIGRVGCFFAGCCAGRPTCSRWGVWSSDRRIVTRRIPTQLLESALALVLAVALLSVILWIEPRPGGLVFVTALASYTLVRQALLRLRALGRRTSLGSLLTAGAAAAALLAALAGLIVAS